MEIIKYRMDELREARILQKECLKQHLPCPPVTWWKAEIKDDNGNTEKQIESKCNSYTRNGLNWIAQHGMYTPQSIRSTIYYVNGIISYKSSTNEFVPTNDVWGFISISSILVGIGNAVESIDAVQISDPISTGYGRVTSSAFFDDDEKKLIVIHQRTLRNNNSVDSVSLTNAGLLIDTSTVGYSYTLSHIEFLVVRDVFLNPIILPAQKTITFSYNFELLYPQ